MAKLIQKGNKIIVENECPPQFKRELTILIKDIMAQYDIGGDNEDIDKAFVSILNSNICVIIDNHFLYKDPTVNKWFKDCVLFKDMDAKEMNLLIANSVQSYKKGYNKAKKELEDKK